MCDRRTDISIRKVETAEIFCLGKQLFVEYAAECSIPLIGEVNPQPQIYELMERAGLMQAFGAYGGEEMIGFATVITAVLPHYGKKVATLESIFVSSSGRTSGAGKKLITAIEEYAKDSECVAILYSAPAGGRLERLLSLLRYKRTNTVFCRSL